MPCKLLIVDLDDTIWPWLPMWAAQFRAELDILELDVGNRESLLDRAQEVHREHGMSEVPDRPMLMGIGPAATQWLACEAGEASVSEGCTPFDGALTTLKWCHENGIAVIAHTDSPALLAHRRLHEAGLHRFFTTISAGNHVRKPNIPLLKSKLEGLSVSPSETVAVGDCLMKDIAPAQELGIVDVHVDFGSCDRGSDDYALLRRVSHWDESAIEQEKRHVENVVPTHSVTDNWGSVLRIIQEMA